MNLSTAILLINDNVKVIKGVYEEGQYPTTFKVLDPNSEIKKGDIVIVETDTRWGFTAVKVTEVNVEHDLTDSARLKWALHKINTEAHEAVLEAENQAIEAVKIAERRKKREELRESMKAAMADGEFDKIASSVAQIEHKS